MRQLVGLLTDKVTNAIAIGARPALAGDGVDISSWKSGGTFLNPLMQVFIDGTGALDLTGPAASTEGVELWGYKLGAWYMFAHLNGGAQIHVAGVGQGYSEVVADLGDFDRLAVAATVSANAATVKFGAMESWTY